MTALAYLFAAIIGDWKEIQFNRKQSWWLQSFFYGTMSVVFLAVSLTLIPTPYLEIIHYALGIGYVFVAMYCYVGLQDWGSTGHNLFMVAWDLCIALAFITKF
jgi:hypothetical protein